MSDNRETRRLYQEMVSLSSNSRLTQETVKMLTEQLDEKSVKLFLMWTGNTILTKR